MADPTPAALPAPLPPSNQANAAPPPPFLVKLFDFVEDPALNPIVSWNADGASFTVHRPSEFASSILPKYFKHNNFSSFVRQLNQYGFRKIDPDHWTFAHEYFKRGKKDLLHEITRKRKSSQLVSNPYSHLYSSTLGGDRKDEKAVVELGNYGVGNEVDLLRRDKELLLKELMATRQQESKLKNRCDAAERRIENLENNVKQMQQFIFHFYSHILSSYPSGSARSRKRLMGPETAESGSLDRAESGADMNTAAPVATGAVVPPLGSSSELAVRPLNQPGLFPPAYIQELDPGSPGKRSKKKARRMSKPSVATMSSEMSGIQPTSIAEPKDGSGDESEQTYLRKEAAKPGASTPIVTNYMGSGGDTPIISALVESTNPPGSGSKAPLPSYHGVHSSYSSTPLLGSGSFGMDSTPILTSNGNPLTSSSGQDQDLHHLPSLSMVEWNPSLDDASTSNMFLASDHEPLMQELGLPPPPPPLPPTSLGNGPSRDDTLDFDLGDLDSLDEEDNHSPISNPLSLFPPLTSVPPGTDMDALIHQIQQFEDQS